MGVSPKVSWMVDIISSEFFLLSPFIFVLRIWFWGTVRRFWELTSWLWKIFKILENQECQILKGCVAKRLLTSWLWEILQTLGNPECQISNGCLAKMQLNGWQGFFWVFFLSPFIFFSRDSDSWKWYVAFGSWQVDFGKFYRLWKIQRAKFQMGVSPKGSWVLLFFSGDSDFEKWCVAFGSWQVDFGKYSRFLKIQNVKF